MSSSSDLPLLAKIGGILVAIGAVLLGLHALNAYEIVGIYDTILDGVGETGAMTVLGAEGGALLLGALLAFVGSKTANGSGAGKAKLIFVLGIVLLIAMVALIAFGPKPG